MEGRAGFPQRGDTEQRLLLGEAWAGLGDALALLLPPGHPARTVSGTHSSGAALQACLHKTRDPFPRVVGFVNMSSPSKLQPVISTACLE